MPSSSVWKDVPDDVLVWVLSFLPPWELLSTVSLVSKEWHRTLQQVPFWKSLSASSSLDPNWTLHQWQQWVLLQDSQPQSILVPRRHAQHLRRSTGTRACLASSTHHRNELLEHVLLETHDEEWILDYDDVEVPSPRSAPYWSSVPSPTANSTETLCFTTRHAQCLVTHVAIEPFSAILREQDEDYSVLGWKQWQVQAYLMRDDEHDVSSTRWGSPSTMTRPRDAEEDPILNAVRLLEELVGPQEFTSLAPSDQDYIPPLLEHSKLVYESDLLTTDEDDWYHHELPSGIVANLIVLKLVDKTTGIPGIGYCTCVQRVVVQGQPFYPSPHVQLWCQQLSEHEYEDPREVQATELFQFLVQMGMPMPPNAPPGFFPWLPPFPHDEDDEDEDEWEDDYDEEEEEDDDDSLESLPELSGRDDSDDDDDSLEDLPPLIGDDGRVLSDPDRQDEDNDESGCGDSLPELLPRDNSSDDDDESSCGGSLPELLPGDDSSDDDSLLQCPHCHVVLDDDSSYDSMPDLWIPNPDDSSSNEEDNSDCDSLPALLPGNVDDSPDSDSPPPLSQPKAEDSSDDNDSDSMPPLIHPDAEDSSDEDSDSTPPPLLPRTAIDDSSDSDSMPPLLPRTTASSEETDDSFDSSLPPLVPTDAGSSPDSVPSRVGNSQGKNHVGLFYFGRDHKEEEKKQKEE